MYEAMEKLLKEGNPKNELISVWKWLYLQRPR